MDTTLSTLELIINGFVLLLTPLILYSLLAGSPPPKNTWLTKYYVAEPWLNVVGNLFVLTICAQAAARLALHFGVIGPRGQELLTLPLGAPFFILLLTFIGLWVKAYRKVRSQNGGEAA